ncbi:MAG: hypothetical protein Q4A60_06540 [Pasteurellaceae bacterium]|nr:hypothetical protein [Pasteurellaceae bacterium]
MIDITLLQAARRARLAGDYHDARTLYQQVAYSYNDFTELEKEAFSKEVADFAGNDDPMYRDILNAIIQFIRNSEEPVLQSKLTNVIKQGYGEPGAELMRYVLYYAEYRDEIKRIKRGRSYLLELPASELRHIQIEDNSQSNPPKLPEEKTIYFESNSSYIPDIQFLREIEEINDYNKLQKLATRFKKENWNESLACLYKATQIAARTREALSLQSITRFALFLQQAGKFEEAKSELQRLFEDVDNYIINFNLDLNSSSELKNQHLKASYLEHLFDKARLIYKREKMMEDAKQFEELSQKFKEERLRLEEPLREENEKRLEKLMEEERQDYEEALVRIRKEAILQREEALRQKIQAEKMNSQNNNEANKDPDAAIASLFFFIVFFIMLIALFT